MVVEYNLGPITLTKKFRVGDRVKVIDDIDEAAKAIRVGAIGHIVFVDDSGYYVKVVNFATGYISQACDDTDPGDYFFEHELELIELCE